MTQTERAIKRGVEVYGLPREMAARLWECANEPDDKNGREGEPADPWDVFDWLCRNEMEG